MSSLRPLFPYVGGKQKIASRLMAEHTPPNWNPDTHIYHDPFVGAGSIFLAVRPKHAIISDVSFYVILVWRMIQNAPDQLLQYYPPDPNPSASASAHTRQKRKHAKAAAPSADSPLSALYYCVREQLNRDQQTHELSEGARAALFLFLTKHSYNGIGMRVNKRGEFNAPIGNTAYRAIDRDQLQDLHLYLSTNDIRIECLDFRKALTPERFQTGDWLYVDPPYDGRKTFREYTSDKFPTQSQIDLASCIQSLVTSRGIWVLHTNGCTDLISSLYPAPTFYQTPTTVYRTVNCKKTPVGFAERTAANELVITNYASLEK